MTPKAKRIAVALLSSAAQDSSLPVILPEDARGHSLREISCFLRASTWPDIVRDVRQQAMRQKYHKGNWHYINLFCDNGGPELMPRERTDMVPEATNAVERLTALVANLQNRDVDASQRSIALAWVLDLVGDIHNALHTSARVTFMDPKGDEDGNLFKLTPSGSYSLHA